jgi:hypothetical protein
MSMIAQLPVPLFDQGAVQFIIFAIMVVITFIVLWITIAK